MVAHVPPSTITPPFGPGDPRWLWDRFKGRYRHVYPAAYRDLFRGMVKIDNVSRHVGTGRTERETAAKVVAFFRSLYGDDWPALHAAAVRRARRYSASRRHKRPAPAGTGTP